MPKFWSVIILSLIGVIQCFGQSRIEATKGVIDARGIDLNHETLSLDGKWEFYWERFLGPDDFLDHQPKAKFIEVPSIWNDQYFNGTVLDGQGYATYKLRILVKDSPALLSIDIPNFYSAYELFINKKLISSNGVVGKSEAETSPEWTPKIKVFESADTLEIICRVSNFHHKRGGIHKSLEIGSFSTVSAGREKKVVANMILTGGLFVLGLFFVVFYIFRIKEKAALYFGLFCLLWAVRSVFSNIYLVSSFFEAMDWAFSLRIEYLSLYASVLFGTLFMSKSFDDSQNQMIKYSISIINLIFIAFTIMLPPILFTKLLPAYQVFIAVNLLFAIYVITKAIFDNQTEAWFSAISVLFGVSIFGYEMINYVLVSKINLVFLNLGYLSIFFLNSLVLAHRFVAASKAAAKEVEESYAWVNRK